MESQRRMRMSLVSLLTKGKMTVNAFDTKQVKINHFTGEHLRNFCAQVEALGLLQLSEGDAP